MKTQITGAAFIAALSVLATPASVQAQVVTLPNNGGVATYQPNAGAGTLTGTLAQGGTSTPFSCGYDVVSGQISGSPSCGQIFNALTLTNVEREIVSARRVVASNLQSMTTTQLLDDTFQRQIGNGFSVGARATGAEASAGASNLGPFAFAGGSFVDDNRSGFEKSGHTYLATVGLDHTMGNTLIGGHVGYTTTELNLTSLNGDLSSDGWLVGGYLTQLFGQRFSVTASAAYTDANVDFRRTFASTNVTADYGHTEWTGSLTANAVIMSTQSLAFTVIGGVTYGAWKDDAYTDSRGFAYAKADGDNTYAKVGGVLTLMPMGMFRPYGFATYNRLLSDPAFTGRDAVNVGGGLAIGSGRLTGGLEVGTQLFQSGQDSTSIGLHLRLAV